MRSTEQMTTRRVRALANLVPVLLLERDRNMGSSGRDWSCYDPKLFAVTCVTHIASHDGLHGHAGVPRDDVISELTTVAARCAPDRPAAEHVEVATWLLDRLLAHGTGSRSHPVDYVELDGADVHHRTEQVRLLREQIGPDGVTVVVSLEPASVHLILTGMDVSVEDAQVAREAILAHQIASGRLDDAVRSAEHALMLTNTYREQLTGWLRDARRDLATLDWAGQVEPALAAALRHLSARVDADTALRSHADEIRTNPDADQTANADQVVALMDRCLQVLTRLQRSVVSARQTWRDEQARQLFAPPAPLQAVDLPADVLDPLCALPVTTDAADLADHIVSVMLPPQLPHLFDVGVIDALTRPPPERDPAPTVDDGDLIDITAMFESYSDAHYELLDELLDTAVDQPTRLSSLIGRIPADTDADMTYDMTMLLGLAALRGFGVDGRTDGRVAATADGQMLDHPLLTMPDLHLTVERR